MSIQISNGWYFFELAKNGEGYFAGEVKDGSVMLLVEVLFLFTVSIDTIHPLSILLSEKIEACLPILKEKVVNLANELMKVPEENAEVTVASVLLS